MAEEVPSVTESEPITPLSAADVVEIVADVVAS